MKDTPRTAAETTSEQVDIFDSEPGSNSYEQRLAVDKLKNGLSEFGLTPNQSKVFIYLGKFGSKTAPEIFRALKLPRTETYHILTILQNRGMATAEFTSPVRYSIVPLDKALTNLVSIEREKINTLSRQRKNVLELWDDIPSFFVAANQEDKDKMQVLQGVAPLNNRMTEMVRECKTEFLMLCTEKDIARFYHGDFFEILDTSTVKGKFIICPAKKTPDFIEEVDRSMIRVLREGKSESTCFIVKDSDEVLLFTKNASYPTDEITAIWTNSKSIIESMRMLFNCCWEKAEIR